MLKCYDAFSTQTFVNLNNFFLSIFPAPSASDFHPLLLSVSTRWHLMFMMAICGQYGWWWRWWTQTHSTISNTTAIDIWNHNSQRVLQSLHPLFDSDSDAALLLLFAGCVLLHFRRHHLSTLLNALHQRNQKSNITTLPSSQRTTSTSTSAASSASSSTWVAVALHRRHHPQFPKIVYVLLRSWLK